MNVEDLWRLTFNRRGPAHTQPKYFAPNGGGVVNLSGLAEHKAVNCLMKWNKCKSDQRSNDDEKQVNEVVNNVKRCTGGHGFTSGVSQVNKICM